MHPLAAWFFAALCSWGVWEFGGLLWRMLKKRQFEDEDGTIVRADEQPGSFRWNAYLTTAVVIIIVSGAIWAWKEVVELSLS